MDFNQITDLTIPEGKVVEIKNSDDILLWSGEFQVIKDGILTDKAKNAGFTLTIEQGKPTVIGVEGSSFTVSNQETYSTDDMEYGNVKYILFIPEEYRDKYYIHAKQDITSFPIEGITEEGLNWNYSSNEENASTIKDNSNTLINWTINNTPTELQGRDAKASELLTGNNLTWNINVNAKCSGELPDGSYPSTNTISITENNKMNLYLSRTKRKDLCFTAKTGNSTIGYTVTGTIDKDIYYSTDQENWISWDGTTVTLANIGDKIYVKNTKNTLNTVGGTLRFTMSGAIAASGECASLINYSNLTSYCFNNLFDDCDSLITAPKLPQVATIPSYCYSNMFRNTSITVAPDILTTTIESYGCSGMFYECKSLITPPKILVTTVKDYGLRYMFRDCTSLQASPELLFTSIGEMGCEQMFYNCTSMEDSPTILHAETLAKYCYCLMFYGCTSLVNAPALPAANLSSGCYEEMFYGCTSLVNAPALPATNLSSYCYYEMFYGCTSLVNAPALPATNLSSDCYYGMFMCCTSLVNAPALPATNLSSYCYEKMFYGCTSLVNAPALPATNLSSGCYYGMFIGCTALTSTPTLSAISLASSCYAEMFAGCTSLTTPPVLSVTVLTENCYDGMFENCTSLTVAPELPATTLASDCYNMMFAGCPITSINLPATTLAQKCYFRMFERCKKLTEIDLPATTLVDRCYAYMFRACSNLNKIQINYIGNFDSSYFTGWVEQGVSSTGDFYYNGSDTTTGDSAIPSGWTVHTF